ncbi:MAG: glycosyltransferase [Eubacterium sp.]|jgi:glycosyltransferase involved in cell wall biosynthesis|nr:glycosyltransferase [Eubacterium sp.]
MKSELVSFIIPVYNVQKYLSRCLESVLQQTYHNTEILLINDGSQDNSLAICEDYQKKDNRIQIINKENGGVSSARNTGLRIASGKYITFVDADDYVKEIYIETLITDMQKKRVDIAACGYYCEEKDHSLIIEENGDSRIISLKRGEMNFCKDKFLSRVSGKLFKAVMLKNKWFDENIQAGEDALFLTEIMTTGNKLYFNKTALYICFK